METQRIKMKRTITQFIMLGVMFLLMALIISMYPEQKVSNTLSHKHQATSVSRVSMQMHVKGTRAD